MAIRAEPARLPGSCFANSHSPLHIPQVDFITHTLFAEHGRKKFILSQRDNAMPKHTSKWPLLFHSISTARGIHVEFIEGVARLLSPEPGGFRRYRLECAGHIDR
jgi:hypothetical protein